VLLALAVFVMAGGAILMLVDRAMRGLEHTRAAAQAADLARSTMARIEAGLGTPVTLNGPVRAWPESDDGRREEDLTDGSLGSGGIAPEETGWEVEIETDPSSFPGLTTVSVRAVRRSPGSATVAAEYTLRQLVRLGGKGDDTAGSKDALADEAQRGLREGSTRTGGGGSAAERGGGRP
jgi:hypothetical protein